VPLFDGPERAPVELAKVQAVPADAWERARIALHPELTLLSLAYPAQVLRAAVREGEKPPRELAAWPTDLACGAATTAACITSSWPPASSRCSLPARGPAARRGVRARRPRGGSRRAGAKLVRELGEPRLGRRRVDLRLPSFREGGNPVDHHCPMVPVRT